MCTQYNIVWLDREQNIVANRTIELPKNAAIKKSEFLYY